MKLIVAEDYKEMSRIAAECFVDVLIGNPSAVLGFATGSTPIGLYDELVREYEAERISFAGAITFNVDEYVGLAASNVNSFRYFMDEHLFSKVDVNPSNVHIPNGEAADADTECAMYEDAIERTGGIDIQLLGIGNNGHIGFNEPANFFSVATHVVDLTESTIAANSRFFENADEVPKRAITVGIGTIMKARGIVLVANGDGKADIVERALFGPVVPEVPASVLQLHPDVTVVVDKTAGSKLPR